MHAPSKVGLGLVAIALGLALGSCKKGGSSEEPDCDTAFRYDGRKVAGKINAGKLGVEAETSMAAVREVDSAVER